MIRGDSKNRCHAKTGLRNTAGIVLGKLRNVETPRLKRHANSEVLPGCPEPCRMTAVSGWCGMCGRHRLAGCTAALGVSNRLERIPLMWLRGLLSMQMVKKRGWKCGAIGTPRVGTHEPDGVLRGDLSHIGEITGIVGNIEHWIVVHVIGALRACTVLLDSGQSTITSDPTLGRSLVGNNTGGNWVAGRISVLFCLMVSSHRHGNPKVTWSDHRSSHFHSRRSRQVVES